MARESHGSGGGCEGRPCACAGLAFVGMSGARGGDDASGSAFVTGAALAGAGLSLGVAAGLAAGLPKKVRMER